ncbi:hypothetical protein BJ742DRAFT_826824 [Cladochytrium replicatum]|nr:hypothetical protein BJ742DRAFT_826824 [Cladochytrium replicatum]
MAAKVFVGGLSSSISTDDLRSKFEEYGRVQDAMIITDRDSGRSRGFGFITYEESKSADTAIRTMHDQEFEGRVISVKMANSEGPRGGRGSGGPVRRDGGGERSYGYSSGGGRDGGGFRGGRSEGYSRRPSGGDRGGRSGGRDDDRAGGDRGYDERRGGGQGRSYEDRPERSYDDRGARGGSNPYSRGGGGGRRERE